MHVLFEDSVLKITSRAPEPAPDGRRTLLSFTGVGHGMGGVNVQKAEFFGTGRNFDNLLFLTDKTRSWGNLLDFDDIAARLAPFREGTELSAIGNSMGGFLAIVASRFMPMRRVVSFVPQFSVDPALVPWEFRWKEYREAIREFKFGTRAIISNPRRHISCSPAVPGSTGARRGCSRCATTCTITCSRMPNTIWPPT